MGADEGHVNGFTNGGGEKKRKEKKKAHVLFVTLACPGHFAPMVQLLYHLETKYPGLTVTVWGNKDRTEDLQNLQSKGDLSGLDLHLEEVFGPIPVYHADPIFPVRAAIASDACFEESEPFRAKLVAEKDSSSGGPTAIITAEFLPWSKDLADQLGIPWYTYFTIAPSFLMNILERPRLVKAGIHPWSSPNVNDLLELTFPNFRHIRIRDLPEEVFFFEKFYGELLERTKEASAIILNTSEELDSLAGTGDAIRQLLPSTRVLPIGPSLQYPGFGEIYASAHSSTNCLEWLDSRPAKSVLYVAFGTLGSVPKEYVMELAAGLEESGVSFLWVLKVTASVKLSDWLPEGFLDRTKGHGIIETAWAPQAKILAHPSTGGFLSHCGWNSTLESLCAGVPLLCWPLSADQPMNARFVENAAKVGLAVCSAKEEDQHSFDNITRQVVAKALKQLMVEDKGDELRRNSAAVQKSLEVAVTKGGSSFENLNILLDELARVSPI